MVTAAVFAAGPLALPRAAVLVPALSLLGAAILRAQQPARSLVEPPGDFRPDGVWRVKARRVAQARAAALARGDVAALNAPSALRAPAPSPMAVSGTLNVPVILVRFHDTDGRTTRDTAQYDAILFGARPPAGAPYTYRSFYAELSNGLLDIEGKSYGWYTLSGPLSQYVGPATGCMPYGTCNGFWRDDAYRAVQAGLREAVGLTRWSVDWGWYDNDGPDGIPNSGDDDGVVDLAVFIQPTMDGVCRGSPTNNDPWAHKGYLGVPTTVPWEGHYGQVITVGDYVLLSGVGGASGCDSTRMMSIGGIAHETGHGLDLPDLYDYSLTTNGVGRWSLMGYGDWSTGASPAHLDGWSLSRLGWVTLRPIASTGTYSLGPVQTRDTVFVILPTVANPRAEFFLLENRQPLLSDTALIRITGPGLLVWHGDSASFWDAPPFRPNNAVPHALALVQADGRNGLDCLPGGQCNRGDAGDPYPGSSGNTVLDAMTTPAAALNAGGPAGFRFDSIAQLAPAGAIRFRVAFGSLTVVSASDTECTIVVDGARTHVFHDIFADGSIHTITADSFQATGTARYLFTSWSDGGARTHAIAGATAGAAYTANMAPAYLAKYTLVGSGTVVASRPVDPVNGTFIPLGDSVTLTARPDSGLRFGGWFGDTVTLGNPLSLRISRPFVLEARFETPLAVLDTALTAAVMGEEYADTIRMSGTPGTYGFRVESGTLPPGLKLDSLGGVLRGVPAAAGAYAFTVAARSLVQSLLLPLRLTVTAPALAASDVANQLLGPVRVLTDAQLRFLDLAGNRNGGFDVGDFAAWLDGNGGATGKAVGSGSLPRRPAAATMGPARRATAPASPRRTPGRAPR
jgi:M6 family metalloprotease-like protein